VEQALLLKQPSGLSLSDLGKLHQQSWIPTTFRLLKGFLRIQACLNLLDGSSYYSPILITHCIWTFSSLWTVPTDVGLTSELASFHSSSLAPYISSTAELLWADTTHFSRSANVASMQEQQLWILKILMEPWYKSKLKVIC